MATWTKFDKTAYHLGNKEVDLDTDTFKVMLVTADPTDSWDDEADVTTEVSGTGYTAGGKTLTSVTWSNAGVWDAADVTWDQDASGPTDILAAIIYLSTGTAANDLLLWQATFSGTKSLQDGSLTLEIANIFTSS